MRLIELEPRWFTFMTHPANGVRFITGVSFLCPHCRRQRLAVQFEPAINPDGWDVQWPTGSAPTWHREGETFETLTLTPSIDASDRIEFENHWHGFITNGECV